MRCQMSLAGAILACLMLAVLTGCAKEEESTPTIPPTSTPLPEQELVVGVEADGYTRAGDKANVGLYPLNINVCEPLVALGPDYEVLPLLATTWEYVGENTWRFSLRRGLKFHDGQEFTAEAVKYTLDRIARTGGGVIKVGPDSVNIVDDSTVEITPTKPNMRLVEQLTHTKNGMLAPGRDPAEVHPGREDPHRAGGVSSSVDGQMPREYDRSRGMMTDHNCPIAS